MDLTVSTTVMFFVSIILFRGILESSEEEEEEAILFSLSDVNEMRCEKNDSRLLGSAFKTKN